jgi:formylglycine-generating enzyme required for sulfatase activity
MSTLNFAKLLQETLRVVGLATLAVALTGCGSDDPPQPAAPQPQAESGKATGQERQVGFAPRRKEEKIPTGIDLSGVDPDTIFEEAETPIPNYAALGPAPPKPEEQFVADALVAGGSSASFVVASRGSTAASGGGAGSSFKLPSGFVALQTAPLINGIPSEIQCETDGSRMVLVPAGASFVGSSSGPEHWRPQVKVQLDAFYIGAQEVTVAQFILFRQKAGVAGKTIEPALNADGPKDHPALGMTWAEARTYSEWIGGALPTEVQWEKAARGSQGLNAPWGNTRPLWRESRTIEQIDPIGTHPDDRSVFGVFDLAGNAREWTGDFFREDSFKTLKDLAVDRRRNWTGPRTPSASAQRVVKGNGPDWSVCRRDGVRANERSKEIGFRCVLNVPGPVVSN